MTNLLTIIVNPGIQQALGILGIPAYHAQQVWADTPEHIAMWNRAMRAKYVPDSGEQPLTRLEWDEILGQHMGVVDVPGAWFGPELAELYPDAKVVVTTRDKDAWFKSCVAAFQHRNFKPFWVRRALYKLIFFWSDKFLAVLRFMDIKQEDVWRFEWHEDGAKAKALKAYDDYYAEVRARIPEEKRIEYDVKAGWAPLCAHLGLDVPTALVDGERVEVPFPRSNDAEAFLARVSGEKNTAIKGALNDWAIRIAFVAAGTYIMSPHLKFFAGKALGMLGDLRGR
jgi:hypothetical protein